VARFVEDLWALDNGSNSINIRSNKGRHLPQRSTIRVCPLPGIAVPLTFGI